MVEGAGFGLFHQVAELVLAHLYLLAEIVRDPYTALRCRAGIGEQLGAAACAAAAEKVARGCVSISRMVHRLWFRESGGVRPLTHVVPGPSAARNLF